MYIADTSNSRIRMVSTSGVISTLAGNGHTGFSGDGEQATNTSLYNPHSVAVGVVGYLYIADSFNLRVRRVKLPQTALHQ